MRTDQPVQPAQSERSDRSVIAYLAFLGVLLATGIDIALPAYDSIEETFGGSPNTSLVITLYLVGMAVGQLIYGPVADRYGRKPAILVALVLYVIGAVASALAPTFGFLLVARFFWGLGAAAPAGLRSAIARDLYSGDAMARINTIMMAVFLLGPVFVPLLGEFMIRVGPWQVIFWFAALLACIGGIWTIHFGETLAEENRRRLDFGSTVSAVGAVVRNRVTFGHLLANVFLSGAFFIFLGSAQPVFDRVFDRSSQFAVLFALTGLLTIPPLLLNNQLIARYGARRMSMLACGSSMLLSAIGFVVVTVMSGPPNFWLWYGWLVLAAGFLTVATPALGALALEPMGEIAGTASSLLFFSSFAFGAGLAAIFDRLVEDTVNPFISGFALYTAIGFAFLCWAGSRRSLRSLTKFLGLGPRNSPGT